MDVYAHEHVHANAQQQPLFDTPVAPASDT